MPKPITRILGPSDANEATEAPTDLRGIRAILRRWYVASRAIIERDSTPKLLRDPALYGIALATLVLCAQFRLYVYWLGDEGIFLHAAVRILGGEVLYRDFFELLPPGSFLAVAAWMKLFGAGFGSMRALAICVIVAIAALLYAAARLSSGNRPLAAMLAVAWVVLSQGVWTVINHHWFTTAASMATAVALLLALDSAPRRGATLVAGLAAGTAAMVTSTRGAILCVAVLGILVTLPRARARLVSAIIGMALVPAAMICYLAASGTLVAAFNDVILWPAHHYASSQALSFGSLAGLPDAPSVALYPATFVLAGATLALGRMAAWRDPRFRVSLALALVGLVGTYPRADISHINFTVPLACPLFALVATDLLGRLRHPVRIALGALLIGLCLVVIGSAIYVRRGIVVGPLRGVETPRGLVMRVDDSWTNDFAVLMQQIALIPPGDAFFFYPYSPMLPYLTGRRHAAPLDVMAPGYTDAAQFRATCVQVVREAQWLVVDLVWTHPVFIRKTWPALRDPDPPEKHSFEVALATAFNKVVHMTETFQLRQRAGDASLELCDKVGATPIPR
jgi:hypothetical protein